MVLAMMWSNMAKLYKYSSDSDSRSCRCQLCDYLIRSFCVAAPRYWNSLPDDVCNIDLDLNDLKKRLKTFLFASAFIGVVQ